MRSSILISAILVLALGSAASAVPIIDTFDVGDSYMAGGLVVWGNRSTTPVNLDWAFLFTLAGKGFDLESYTFALIHLAGDNEVELFLMADDSGLPGAVIESITATVPSPGSTLVTVQSTSHPRLDPNTSYWFGMSAPATSGAETTIRWHIGGVARAPYASREDEASWTLAGPNGLVGACRLQGTVAVATESASWSRVKALY